MKSIKNIKSFFSITLVVLVLASGCKPTTEKQIQKAERKITKNEEKVKKHMANIAGLEQKIKYLNVELEKERNAPNDKEIKRAEKRQKEIDDLEKKLLTLKKELDDNSSFKDNEVEIALSKPVTSFIPKKGTFNRYVELQGKVTSKESIIVASEAGGTIVSINVREGQNVSRGQALANLDKEIMTNSIIEIETALKLARDVFERQERLWNQNIGTEIQYLQAKNNVESLEKKLTTAQSQMAKTTVRSPIYGTIDEVFANSGELAGAGTPIARVVNLSKVQVEAEVPETYLGKFKRGDYVDVEFPSLNTTKKARISAIGQFINPGNRTFKIEMNIPNSGGVLKPNLLATVKLREYSSKGNFVIPSRIIQQDAQGNYVYAIDSSNTVKKVMLGLGKTYNGEAEIVSGLTGNENIIDKGYRDVVVGDIIENK